MIKCGNMLKVLRMMIDTYQVFKVSYEKFYLNKIHSHTKFSFKYGKHGHQCLHRKKADYKYDHKNNNNGFKQCRIMNIIYVVEFLSHKKKIVLICLLVY